MGSPNQALVTIDPGTGTGTYLLGIIEHSLPKLSDRYGSGSTKGYATQLGKSLYGFELMVGPYAVTELRLTNALRDSGAASSSSPQIYLTDTLESPERQPPQGNLYVERELAKQARMALEVKKAVNVLVCLGNPPYDRSPADAAAGGWVRYGDEGVDDRPILEDFLEPARNAGHGGDLKNLYNLYVYFWRWALWKVFEQEGTDGPGIVSYISASSYLDGDAFSGMREHLRRACDEVWILDLGGEGRGPRKSENIFNIQTPVAIAVAFRKQNEAEDKPAKVRYGRIAGTRDEKLAALDKITDFDQVQWQDCPDEWQAAFKPAGKGLYFNWPLMTNLMPWQHTGVELKRTWPVGEDKETLGRRWKSLVESENRALALRATDDRQISKSYKVNLFDYMDSTPIDQLSTDAPVPPIHRYALRFLDRQYLIGDGRLISRPRPSLWESFGERQIYMSSLFSQSLDKGPALVATADVIDRHFFRRLVRR